MRWAYGIIIFFIIIATSNAVLIYLSIKSNTGLIEEDAYEKGLRYDETIAKLKAANVSGLEPEVSFSSADEQGKRLVTIKFLHGDGVASSAHANASEATIQMKRPAGDANDSSARLELRGRQYQAEMLLPTKGLWLSSIELLYNNEKLLWQERQFLR